MKKAALVLLSFFLASSLFSQSAAVMDSLVGNPELTWTQVSYLVFTASGQLAETSEPERAFALLQQLDWVAPGIEADSPVPLADFAWLLARTWRVSGGLWFNLFPGPRYAFREFQYRGWLPAGLDPGSEVSGAQAIGLLGKILAAFPPLSEARS
jgi:hypothetical protein